MTSEAVLRLTEALWEAGSTTPGLGYSLRARLDTAESILAADPVLANVLELGLAWQAAEAALPEGWSLELYGSDGPLSWAGAMPLASSQLSKRVMEEGRTPAEALRNLAARLREVTA